MKTTLLVYRPTYDILNESLQSMPITLAKAYEILALNVWEAAKRMPEDVKDSLALALSCIAFAQAARKSGIMASDFYLKGEAPEPSSRDNHQETPPPQDEAPASPGP